MSGQDDQNIYRILRNQGFLRKGELFETIHSDLHKSKIWADIFWRRRKNHELRDDPELNVIKDIHFNSCLEIGAGYGRFLRKLILSNIDKTDKKYTGVEICQFFKPYSEIYFGNIQTKPNFIYDDFLLSNKFSIKKYDLIVLPMNTLPSFPNNKLELLFERIKNCLSKKGKFVFSNYKIQNPITDNYLRTKLSNDQRTEVLVGENDRIVDESKELILSKTNYGAFSKYLSIYHRFNNNYIENERSLFITQINYYTKNFIEEFVLNQGFVVNKVDESSHSLVFVISLEK